MIEASLVPLYEEQESYLDVINFLESMGMRPHMICERTFSRKTNQQLQIDLVYFIN